MLLLLVELWRGFLPVDYKAVSALVGYPQSPGVPLRYHLNLIVRAGHRDGQWDQYTQHFGLNDKDFALDCGDDSADDQLARL